jgi:hypothetical protein
MDRTENTVRQFCMAIVAMGTCLFSKSLLSNGCCKSAYLAVVVTILIVQWHLHSREMWNIFPPKEERKERKRYGERESVISFSRMFCLWYNNNVKIRSLLPRPANKTA